MFQIAAYIYAIGLPAAVLCLTGWLITRPRWSQAVGLLGVAVISLVSAAALRWLSTSVCGLSAQAQVVQLQAGPWMFCALSAPLVLLSRKLRPHPSTYGHQ